MKYFFLMATILAVTLASDPRQQPKINPLEPFNTIYRLNRNTFPAVKDNFVAAIRQQATVARNLDPDEAGEIIGRFVAKTLDKVDYGKLLELLADIAEAGNMEIYQLIGQTRKDLGLPDSNQLPDARAIAAARSLLYPGQPAYPVQETLYRERSRAEDNDKTYRPGDEVNGPGKVPYSSRDILDPPDIAPRIKTYQPTPAPVYIPKSSRAPNNAGAYTGAGANYNNYNNHNYNGYNNYNYNGYNNYNNQAGYHNNGAAYSYAY